MQASKLWKGVTPSFLVSLQSRLYTTLLALVVAALQALSYFHWAPLFCCSAVRFCYDLEARKLVTDARGQVACFQWLSLFVVYLHITFFVPEVLSVFTISHCPYRQSVIDTASDMNFLSFVWNGVQTNP